MASDKHYILVFHNQIYKGKHLRKEIFTKTYICESSGFRPLVLIKENTISWEGFSKYIHISSPKILIFFSPVTDSWLPTSICPLLLSWEQTPSFIPGSKVPTKKAAFLILSFIVAILTTNEV